MYIWVVLASFIVALYSFNLSYRADMKEMLILPQAEAIIGKMILQHRAAKEYVKDRIPDSNQGAISYYPGELRTNVELKKYLPYGFKNERGDGDFITLIYCLDKSDPRKASLATGCGGAPLGVSCCNEVDAESYLVTFGCIPRKWKNLRTGKPKAEFIKALRGITISGTGVGYSEILPNDELNDPANIYKSKIALRARSKHLASLPDYIVSKKLNGTDRSFSDVCGEDNRDDENNIFDYSCDKCLMYINSMNVN